MQFRPQLWWALKHRLRSMTLLRKQREGFEKRNGKIRITLWKTHQAIEKRRTRGWRDEHFVGETIQGLLPIVVLK